MSDVYLNFAATSYPKPDSVIRRMVETLSAPPADGRRGSSGRRDPLLHCRRLVGRLIGASDPGRIILTPSATISLNLAIQGVILGMPGKPRVVTSVLEHNSVLRPLWHLKRADRVELDHLEIRDLRDPDRMSRRIGPDCRLLVLTACSNVTGLIPDLGAVAAHCRRHETILVLDAAQAAGSQTLDVNRLPQRSLVALAGHKGLLGPQGTGALYVGEGLGEEELPPVLQGGTGVRSNLPGQPPELPLRLEAGTPNSPGFAGLAAGIEHVLATGVENIGRHKDRLVRRLREGLMQIPGVEILDPDLDELSGGVLSFVQQGWEPRESALVLEESFGIRLRGGLHCAPLIHQALGCPEGSVRASVGWCSTEDDVDCLTQALDRMAVKAA